MQQHAGTKGAIGSILTLGRRLNRDRVIRLDADKQLCQLPESGQKNASFAHLAPRPRGLGSPGVASIYASKQVIET
jgi:hypothetical protein